MDQKFKQDKGQAGLSILLSVIVMLFIIGLLVMIFSLMGSEMRDSTTISASESTTAVQDDVAFTSVGTTLTDCNSANQGALTSVIVNNASTILTNTNYTYAGCVLTAVTTSNWNATTVSNVTYTYTYAGNSYTVINDTASAIGGVTDWFDIFIVISAMVVLILLTVIIITAIRSSGMIAGGSNTGANQVGTA